MSFQMLEMLKERVIKLEKKVEAQEQLLTQISQAAYSVIPDPPTFRGVVNGISFEEWVYKINAKLQTFPIKDLDNKTKILYIASHTAETPFDIIKVHLPIGPVSSHGRHHRKVYSAPQELLIDLRRRYIPTCEECTVQ